MDGNGETTIFYIKIWNHPIETTIYKWLALGFQVVYLWMIFHHRLWLYVGFLPFTSSKHPPCPSSQRSLQLAWGLKPGISGEQISHEKRYHDMNHQNTGWIIYRNPCIMVYEIIPLQLGITGYYSISSIIIPYILEIARNNQSFFIAQMSVGRAPLAFKQIKFQQLTVKEKTSP